MQAALSVWLASRARRRVRLIVAPLNSFGKSLETERGGKQGPSLRPRICVGSPRA